MYFLRVTVNILRLYSQLHHLPPSTASNVADVSMARRFFDGPQASLPEFQTSIPMNIHQISSELFRMQQQFPTSSVPESLTRDRSSATSQLQLQQLQQLQQSQWSEDFGNSLIQNDYHQISQSGSHIPLYRSSVCVQ